ncbi:hypothetical protein SARC_02416 [Sphaeroforma arctica JP610]|uniref:PCIF1 WW domain-containing protein n=1 Tax=Sphaeroforma arctica JP610 TaxID=667725 RepID=A0A0L0G8Q5_9EUKA|nr:hypothetical protein SARC_02416 [Sphaeroforma arctica JP610]KNC85417.1 hypothetical protein SARC_02416 [Sphaeroforma arctica JP610]|eukprot:XP_014159319.1 hypothetical protein SARC_02416 [Sphaeroforma arctica JP610]
MPELQLAGYQFYKEPCVSARAYRHVAPSIELVRAQKVQELTEALHAAVDSQYGGPSTQGRKRVHESSHYNDGSGSAVPILALERWMFNAKDLERDALRDISGKTGDEGGEKNQDYEKSVGRTEETDALLPDIINVAEKVEPVLVRDLVRGSHTQESAAEIATHVAELSHEFAVGINRLCKLGLSADLEPSSSMAPSCPQCGKIIEVRVRVTMHKHTIDVNTVRIRQRPDMKQKGTQVKYVQGVKEEGLEGGDGTNVSVGPPVCAVCVADGRTAPTRLLKLNHEHYAKLRALWDSAQAAESVADHAGNADGDGMGNSKANKKRNKNKKRNENRRKKKKAKGERDGNNNGTGAEHEEKTPTDTIKDIKNIEGKQGKKHSDTKPSSKTSAERSAEKDTSTNEAKKGDTAITGAIKRSNSSTVKRVTSDKHGKPIELDDKQHKNTEELFHNDLYSMLLRYNALSGMGFQAACSEHVFAALKSLFRTDFECFSSPLNTHHPLYCSAYIDTDFHFGSRGNFFDFYPASGSFQANPPFVTGVMERMAKHIETLLQKANTNSQPLSFIVVVPGWVNEVSYQTMLASPFMEGDGPLLISKDDHGFCDGAQHQRQDRYRNSPFDTAIFFLRTDAARNVYGERTFESDAILRKAFAEALPSDAAVARRARDARGFADLDRMGNGSSKKRKGFFKRY